MALAGRIVALAEGQQLEDLAALLDKEGALALRCPLLSILDPADDGPVLAWLADLIAGQFDWIILLTGEGLRRLLTCADRHGQRDAVVAAFAKTRTLTRGPKPGKALQEIALKPSRVASAPTTDGVIASLKEEPLTGLTVGVQLYREDNLPLTKFLADKEAQVRTVLPYVYAPASDAERVLDLIGRMEGGAVDALVFTSSPQIDRLFEVALEHKVSDKLRAGLAKTKVAAVGPIVADNLRTRQIRVDICPEQGWVMKNLVQQIKKEFEK